VIETIGPTEGAAFVLGAEQTAEIRRAATESWNRNPRDEPSYWDVETPAGKVRVTVWPEGHKEALRAYIKEGRSRMMMEQLFGRN
jgi:hypothetical protein